MSILISIMLLMLYPIIPTTSIPTSLSPINKTQVTKYLPGHKVDSVNDSTTLPPSDGIMKYYHYINDVKTGYGRRSGHPPAAVKPTTLDNSDDDIMKYYHYINDVKTGYGKRSGHPPAGVNPTNLPPSDDDIMKYYHYINDVKTGYGKRSGHPPAGVNPTNLLPSVDNSDDAIMKYYQSINKGKVGYDEHGHPPPPAIKSTSQSSSITNTDGSELNHIARESRLPASHGGHQPLAKNLTVYFRYNDTNEGSELLLVFGDQAKVALMDKSDSKVAKWWVHEPHCEKSSVPGEIRACIDSKDSMLKLVYAIMGTSVKKMSTPPGKLQLYKVVGPPKTIRKQATVCHKQVFNTPSAVYACHSVPDSQVRLVPLVGSDGKEIEAITVCHLNTTSWDPKGLILEILNAKPGPPVCHFLATDDYVWVKA